MQIKKTKNISRDVFGTKEGRIHLGKQNISRIQIKKMKGLKRKLPEKPTEGAASPRKNSVAPPAKQSKKSDD